MKSAEAGESMKAFALLDDIPDGLLVASRDFTVLAWNKTLETWTGITSKQIVGKSLLTHYPHFGTAKYGNRIGQVFEYGSPAIFSSGLHKHIIDSKLATGKMRSFYTEVNRLSMQHKGEALALFTFRDVTDVTAAMLESSRAVHQLNVEVIQRKEAELKALNSMEHIRLILETSLDGILVVNREGVVQFLNPAVTRLMNRDAKDIQGEAFGFPLSDVEAVEMDVIRGKEGSISVEMRTVDIEWEGAACKLVSLHDITDRKQAEDVQIKSKEGLLKTLDGVVAAMSGLLVARDPYTAGHQKRVSLLVEAIGKRLGLKDDVLKGLNVAALIHDIGKISVPSEILSQPGRLSEIEFNFMKEHPQVGYDILKDIEFPWPVADSILQHHERLDGSGYPQGLRGKDIILEARILAVADVSEAMLSHRPYRPALNMEKLQNELKTGRTKRYDAKVVDACLKCFSEGFTFGKNG